MIEFNLADFNMQKILDESRLANILTKHKMRFFGLANPDNPPIYIGFKSGLDATAKKLQTFFQTNGIFCDVHRGEDDVLQTEIAVGLRKDLRKDVVLSTAIIKTIVYTFEGRLEFDEKFKLSNIPKFETNEKKSEKPAEKPVETA